MKKVVFALALASLAGFASAQRKADVSGMYIGGDLGGTMLSCSGCTSETKTSFGIFGGYQFNENFAAELSYKSLASWEVSRVTLRYNSYGASLKATYPVSKDVGVSARLGFNSINVSASGGGSSVRSEGKTKALFGAGAEYVVSPNLSVRAELTNHSTEDKSAGLPSMNNISVGFAYKF